jgi:hypothetical protein
LVEENKDGILNNMIKKLSSRRIPVSTYRLQFNYQFTNEIIQSLVQEGKRVLLLEKVFGTFPVAMLETVRESK